MGYNLKLSPKHLILLKKKIYNYELMTFQMLISTTTYSLTKEFKNIS